MLERAQCKLDAKRGFRAAGCPNASFDGEAEEVGSEVVFCQNRAATERAMYLCRIHHIDRWRHRSPIPLYSTSHVFVGLGVYILDQENPEANGWPHCYSDQGKHLYYNTAGRWYVSSAFTPDKNNCKAYYT